VSGLQEKDVYRERQSGSVKTPAQKSEAGKLAKTIPNVRQVVNEIEVKS